MLRLHTNLLEGGLRNATLCRVAWRRFTWLSLCIALFVCAGCSNTPAGAGGQKGGFYSYVDAQGNAVTVSRDTRSGGTAGDDSIETDSTPASVEATASSPRYASNPNELWSLEDESYITSDDFESEETRKQRERFVSYPDETGQLVTHPVDMVAARNAAEGRKEAAQDPGEDVLPEPRVVTRWTSIGADCCQQILADATTLADGDEKPVNVVARPRGSIVIEERHPARAFRLNSSVSMIQVQSWNKKGYLYPQALFLDENGIPLARVAQIFTRKKAQTWAAQPYLVGEMPVEPGAKWLVLFLNYAQINPQGAISQDQGYLTFDDVEVPLAIRAELVVRATSGVF